MSYSAHRLFDDDRPAPSPRHPDLLPEPEDLEAERESLVAEAVKRYNQQHPTQRCVCPCDYEMARMRRCMPCRRPPTQEDGLCDLCREYKKLWQAAKEAARDDVFVPFHCHTLGPMSPDARQYMGPEMYNYDPPERIPGGNRAFPRPNPILQEKLARILRDKPDFWPDNPNPPPDAPI